MVDVTALAESTRNIDKIRGDIRELEWQLKDMEQQLKRGLVREDAYDLLKLDWNMIRRITRNV